MKISFLVTYYNQEKYVRQSMESILAIDKPSEWEILVGDDGSADGTVEICNEYRKRYPEQIKLFVMPREKGKPCDAVRRASANRLNLLEHCTGDCFCVLDGDDFYYDTNFVKEAIDVFERDKGISIVSFGFGYFRDGELEEEKLLPAGIGQRVDTRRYISNLYLPAGACVHRLLWDKERVEYIKRIGYFDDNDIVINSLNYGNMYYINRSIYAYRQTAESVFNSMSIIEEAILNINGMEIDNMLTDKEYKNELLLRNTKHICLIYLLRKKIKYEIARRDDLRNGNFDYSVNEPKGLLYKLLNFETLSFKGKLKMGSVLLYLVFVKPKLCIRAYLTKFRL